MSRRETTMNAYPSEGGSELVEAQWAIVIIGAAR